MRHGNNLRRDPGYDINTYDVVLEFTGANIFTALQQQLGLKLQKVKGVAADILVVDHADQKATKVNFALWPPDCFYPKRGAFT